MTFKTLLGCQFEIAEGERVSNYQMVSEDDGKAYALADFRNGKCERFDCVDRFLNQGRDFLTETIKIECETKL